MELEMSFAKVLAQWMEKEGHKHAFEIAGVLGCAVSTAYEYVNGDRLPPNTRIPALARVLGIPERRLKQVITADRAHRTAETVRQ
jgi:hypothetical protein